MRNKNTVRRKIVAAILKKIPGNWKIDTVKWHFRMAGSQIPKPDIKLKLSGSFSFRKRCTHLTVHTNSWKPLFSFWNSWDTTKRLFPVKNLIQEIRHDHSPLPRTEWKTTITCSNKNKSACNLFSRSCQHNSWGGKNYWMGNFCFKVNNCLNWLYLLHTQKNEYIFLKNCGVLSAGVKKRLHRSTKWWYNLLGIIYFSICIEMTRLTDLVNGWNKIENLLQGWTEWLLQGSSLQGDSNTFLLFPLKKEISCIGRTQLGICVKGGPPTLLYDKMVFTNYARK